ncbi:uncharacterized protein LOC131245924 isoform X3 [Magnolia sinica]|uniref:uncharacterized protein LOC131245924 isoform X3 n=1 Tax=Magnolia sinica TaxID=86752 RepID=UPI00265AA835|nr:uncharacterized protein LOC131245924 isoform X3 [Magnolia sinica]
MVFVPNALKNLPNSREKTHLDFKKLDAYMHNFKGRSLREIIVLFSFRKSFGGHVIGISSQDMATHVGSESALSQIFRLVESSQMARAPVQKFAERISKYFVPFDLDIAIVKATNYVEQMAKEKHMCSWSSASC